MKAWEYLLSQPLLVTQEAADAALEIVLRTGEPKAVQAREGRPQDGTRNVERRGSVAVIPVVGPIFRYADMFTELCGGVTTQQLAKDITTCLDDMTCQGVILEMDTPGGEAAGIGELSELIHEGTTRKPIVAYVSHDAGSAGCWLACACSEVVMAPSSSMGSIGVVMGYTKRAPMRGETKYEFVSSQSPGKRPNLDTEAGKAIIQQRVDDLASVFISAVAEYRDTTPEKVISDFGAGSMLIASKAIDAGMADRLGTLESLIVELQNPNYPGDGKRTPDRKEVKMSASTRTEESSMNPFKILASMWEKDPKAVQAAIDADGGTSVSTSTEPAPVKMESKLIDVKDDPTIKALMEKVNALSAQNATLETENATNRAARILAENERLEAQATSFIQSTYDRVLPGEREALKADFILRAQDDAARPLATGSRAQNLRDMTMARPLHHLFEDQVSGRALSSEIFALAQRPDATNPESDQPQTKIDELMALDPRGRELIRNRKSG